MKRVAFLIISLISIAFLFVFWGGSRFTEYTIESKISELRDSTDFCEGNNFAFCRA